MATTSPSMSDNTNHNTNPNLKGVLSDFTHRHERHMNKKEGVEGWKAELHWYLNAPEWDLTSPHINVVKWWQVCLPLTITILERTNNSNTGPC